MRQTPLGRIKDLVNKLTVTVVAKDRAFRRFTEANEEAGDDPEYTVWRLLVQRESELHYELDTLIVEELSNAACIDTMQPNAEDKSFLDLTDEEAEIAFKE